MKKLDFGGFAWQRPCVVERLARSANLSTTQPTSHGNSLRIEQLRKIWKLFYGNILPSYSQKIPHNLITKRQASPSYTVRTHSSSSGSQ
jgi:hypothetical protein